MSHSNHQRLVAQQVSQIYNQVYGAIFGVSLVALVSVVLFWSEARSFWLLAWLAALILLSLVRLGLLKRYQADTEHDQHAEQWARRYLLLELVIGLSWSLLLPTVAPDNGMDQVLIMLILGSMATGALPMLSMYVRIYGAFLFSLGLPTAAMLFTMEPDYSRYLGLFTLIYILALWLSGQANYRRNRNNLLLSIENYDLVESLRLTNKQLLRQVQETQSAEQHARDAEERFRTLANATNEGVILYEKGRIIDCNKKLLEMLGYSRTQLLDLNIEQLFAPADQGLVLELLSHKDGVLYELNCLANNGNIFPVELIKRKLPQQDKHVYVFTLHDISELKYMAEIKDQFISTVSHELRTPITSIHASLGLVLGGVTGSLPEKVQELLAIAQQNSERLNLLINDLLDVQKMDVGKLAFNYGLYEVNELIQHAVELNQAFLDKHDVGIKLHKDQTQAMVKVDRSRFIQVLTNLLSNAAKFSPAGSEIELQLEPRKDFIQLHIHDQGPGIPLEFQDKLFERFSQADGSDSRSHGGSGLGLHISKKLLNEMGCDIDFRSAPEQGTTFTVTMPMEKA